MALELKPLSPTNDFVFKKVFIEHIEILEDFLMAVLDLPQEEYSGLTVVDPNLDREFIDDKLGVLDIKVHLSSGKVINIELQVRPQKAIWNRITFYTAKLLTEQIKSGDPYDRIKRVISILIADFMLIPGNEIYHNRFRLYDERTGARFPNSIEINTLELSKITKADGTQLGNWMRYFQARTEEDFMDAAQTNPAINKAWGVVKVLSGDEQARALADAREKARMDLDSLLGDARYDGRQEGLQEGLKEGLQEGLKEGLQEGERKMRLDVARNALRKEMPYADIVDLTGLSLDEIKRLAAKL